MTRRRTNAGEGYGVIFHGAFKDKKDAKKKERQVKGFIQPRNIEGHRRYVVMSERKNPIKREKKSNVNPNLIEMIRPGDRVTIVNQFGQKHTGRAVMRSSSGGWVLNMGGPHGTPAIADERNIVKVKHRSSNPSELVVLGANPHPGQTINLPPNATIIIRTNPSAELLREEFVGRPAEFYTNYDEPHMPRGDYAQLGELLALYVKPVMGGQVQEINFRSSRPLLVADESARQLYFVGGDQDISSSLSVFAPGVGQMTSGLVELGEVRRIDYKQRKEHLPDPEIDEWRHDFGEETGVRPTLWFDPVTKRLLLQGGAYEVRSEGIVN